MPRRPSSPCWKESDMGALELFSWVTVGGIAILGIVMLVDMVLLMMQGRGH
jgi:hypothetical protein